MVDILRLYCIVTLLIPAPGARAAGLVAGTRPEKGVSPMESTNDYRQWIADVYHCSDCWGQTMSEEDMLYELTETIRQKDPDDYSPDPYLYRECAAYWNELCALYPN